MLAEQNRELILHQLQAATAGADQHAHLIRHGGDIQPGLVERLARRRIGVLREGLGAARRLAVKILQRVEVLELSGDADTVVTRVELGDWPRARDAREQRLPRRRDIVAEGCHKPHARDTYPYRHARSCLSRGAQTSAAHRQRTRNAPSTRALVYSKSGIVVQGEHHSGAISGPW